MTDLRTQRSRIDGPNHLAHDTRPLVAELHLRMKARERSRARRETNDDRREHEKIVRLHDHCKAPSVLSMTATARKRDCVNVTANHEAAP
jgi:hypothetical protein